MILENKFDNRDLMVGDYVLYEGEPTQVMQIDDEGNCWTEKNPFTENDGIEPIRLSKLFFTANGFERYDEDKSCYLFPGDPSLTVKYYDDDNVNGFCVGHLEDGKFNGFIFIDYVHDLQHIIRMFGVLRFGNLSNNLIIC